MEPGHEDREYWCLFFLVLALTRAPQWSPVMKTGNTSSAPPGSPHRRWPQWSPVMKTGNTIEVPETATNNSVASMEPGHEDREYGTRPRVPAHPTARLNGARS